jgi:hypothetical protein
MFDDIGAIEGPTVDDTSTDTTNPGGTDQSTEDNTDPTTHENTDSNTQGGTGSSTNGNTDSETHGNTDSNTGADTDIDTACEDGGRKTGQFCDLAEHPCDCENACSEEFFSKKDGYIYYCHAKCRDGDCGYLGENFACIDKFKSGMKPVCAAMGALASTEFSVPLFPVQLTPTSSSTTLRPWVAGYPEIPMLDRGFAVSDVDVTFVFLGVPAQDAQSQYWRLEIVIPRALYRPGTITADANGLKGFAAHLYRVRTDIDFFESIAMVLEGGQLTLQNTPEPCTDRNNCSDRVSGRIQFDLAALQFAFPTPKS